MATGSRPAPHLRGFLEYCRKQSLPLDFLSWHMYAADPQRRFAARSVCGASWTSTAFRRPRVHLNEWNYLPNNDWGAVFGHDGARMQKSFEEAGGPQGAAFVACVLLGLQDAPLDMANFYTGDNGCWGLFNVFGVPKKTYHAFRAFKALVDHPARVAVEGGKAGELNTVAGLSKDGRELVVVVSNFKSADRQLELVLQNLPWTGPSVSELLLLDQSRDLERIRKQEHDERTITIVQDLPRPGSCWCMCGRASRALTAEVTRHVVRYRWRRKMRDRKIGEVKGSWPK